MGQFVFILYAAQTVYAVTVRFIMATNNFELFLVISGAHLMVVGAQAHIHLSHTERFAVSGERGMTCKPATSL